MSTWNHRVLLTEHDLFGPTYDIIEVFYDRDGSIRGYTAADVQSYELSLTHIPEPTRRTPNSYAVFGLKKKKKIKKISSSLMSLSKHSK